MPSKGAVGEVGLVAQMAEEKIDIEIAGTVQQRISACLNVLDNLLSSKQPVVSSMVVAQKHALSKMNLIQSVLHIMGIRDMKSVSKNSSLAELGKKTVFSPFFEKITFSFERFLTLNNLVVLFKGMDSLMAVEIKQALEREFEVILTAQELRSLTFGRLQELTDSGGKCDKSSAIIQELPANISDVQKNMLLRSLGNEATAPQIILPLNVTDATKQGDTYAMFIPGVEGVISPVLYKLCKTIEVPVYGLQLHAHCREESLSNLISLISKVTQKSFSV